MRAKLTIPLILVALGALGCSNDHPNAGGSGFVETDDILVSAEMNGRITQLNVTDGSLVSAGDTIAIIDPSRLELELASAEAGRAATAASLRTARLAVTRGRESERFAKGERDRIQKLVNNGSASTKQLDQLQYEFTQATNGRESAEANVAVIEAQLAKLEADIDRIKRQLQDTHPVSPINGTVVEKYVKAGELVNAGKAIVKIAPLDTVWVKVYLSSGEFASIRVGQKADISTETGGQTYQGEVIWTSAEAEFTPKNVQTEKSRANLVYAVKVRIPNTDGRLKVGMPVFVTLAQS